ncbi:MAG: 1-phosphofructokinase family hexose kinase [Thermoleophilia bacterium]|nr:1-phosphofructokinase family hexose kinase [Thermoleophilia bacterium]
MIITVTPNAALDKTIQVPSMQLGMRHRGAQGLVAPGGKGINVARALRILHEPVIATGLVGGETGARILSELAGEGILSDFVSIAGESRSSTVLIDPTSGRQTEIIENGPSVTVQELDALLNRLEYVARDAYAVVLAGSLPRDVGEDWYGEAIKRLRKSRTHLILDSEGEPLRQGVSAEPYLVAPNQREAEDLVGHEFGSEGDVITALEEIADMGARNVLITTETGVVALLREGSHARRFQVQAPRVDVLSTVGAGDALLAGYLSARLRGGSAEEALLYGVACGTASTLVAGAARFDLREVKRQLAQTTLSELSLR